MHPYTYIYIESRYNLEESNLVWQKVAKQRSCCNDLWCRRRLRSRCSMVRTKPTSCTTWRCQMKNRLKQQKTFMLFENSYTHLYVYWYHLTSLYLLREFVLCTPCVMHRKFANRWLKVRPLVSLQLDGLWLAGPGSVALTAAEQAIPCPMQILGAPNY